MKEVLEIVKTDNIDKYVLLKRTGKTSINNDIVCESVEVIAKKPCLTHFLQILKEYNPSHLIIRYDMPESIANRSCDKDCDGCDECDADADESYYAKWLDEQLVSTEVLHIPTIITE